MNIKKIRIEKGISQQELATLIGVHVNTIKNWEANKSTISPKKEHLLLKIFNENLENNRVSEPKPKYSGDVIEDLREVIYSLKDTISAKEEIIEMLKEKISNLSKNNSSSKAS